jgi:hypothetical protein
MMKDFLKFILSRIGICDMIINHIVIDDISFPISGLSRVGVL